MAPESLHSVGLYLHIPFCKHRCAYCDFNTYTGLEDIQQKYALALAHELEQVSDQQNLRAMTIYFGGGTPSLMPSGDLAQILNTVASCFDVHNGIEVTLEANPESVDLDYLGAIRALGVNRISIGAQSAHQDDLILLERGHNFDTVTKAVENSRRAGFDNLNLDLIYGLPGQDLVRWERSLKAVLDLKPEHLSLYCLTIEPGTPMRQWLESGRIPEPDPDLSADQYELACEMLADQGYGHYEISNWAKDGRACQHNLIYWRNQSYLGLGAGAHGHAAGYRYHVVKQPRVYIRRLSQKWQGDFPFTAATASKQLLSERESMSDITITQLRLLEEGLDLNAFKAKFGRSLEDAYPGVTEQLISWDLLIRRNHHLLLTERGRFLSNQVFYRYL